MSDPTNSAPSIEQQIDSMIQQSGGLHTAIGPARNSTADLRVEIDGTGKATTTVIAPASHAQTPDLAPGLDLDGLLVDIDRETARLTAELAEVIRHNAVTGEPVLRLQGEDRARRERSLEQLAKTREFQVARNEVIKANRAAAEQAAKQAQQEELLSLAFTQGNPERAQALKSAIDEVEARRIADLIVKSRHAR